MEKFGFIADIFGYIFSGTFILLGIIASVRAAVKASRGERVDVPAVGVIRDLPGSVTGLNKHLDDEMIGVNQQNKRDGE